MTDNFNFDQLGERYANFYTDFAFKKYFGTEANKDLLISFLNALLSGQEDIVDIKYLPTEHLSSAVEDRRAIFDIYCENKNGDKFIIEMQKTEQDYFKDRALYYASFPIREFAPRGDWNYELKRVYCIGILNFKFDDENTDVKTVVKLMDTKKKTVFYDKLTFIFLEMPNFKKALEELDNMYEKWLFAIKNLNKLLVRPAELSEKVFLKLFETAEIAKFSPAERRDYELVAILILAINIENCPSILNGTTQMLSRKIFDIHNILLPLQQGIKETDEQILVSLSSKIFLESEIRIEIRISLA